MADLADLTDLTDLTDRSYCNPTERECASGCPFCGQCQACSADWRNAVACAVYASGGGRCTVIEALMRHGCCRACFGGDTSSKPKELLRPQFPLVRDFAAVAADVTTNHLLLLDVDETVLITTGPGNDISVPTSAKHLLAALQVAKYVMFVTARRFAPGKSWEFLRDQLAAVGIEATEDHVLFTGSVDKGPWLYLELVARDLHAMPTCFVDDNRESVRSAMRYLPHIQGYEFRGSFTPNPMPGLRTMITLPALPHSQFQQAYVEKRRCVYSPVI